MLGTLVWRIKEAVAVLSGKKKTVSPQKYVCQTEKNIHQLEPFEIQDKELADYINSLSIEFCFSEFGENRVNAGGNEFNENRLEPSLSTLKKYFPNAKYTVYSDFDLEIPGVNLKKIIVSPIKDEGHPRHLYRTTGYFKYKSLLESDADFKCIIDSDMYVVSEEIYRLVYLTQIFGFCAAYNPRNLLKRDMQISLDAKEITDLSGGFGHSYNQSPMTLWKNHEQGTKFYENCCKQVIQNPSRNSLIMWNAAKETRFSPYLLPAEFCVCTGDEGIGNEVMLHVGHPSVAKFYNVKT